jgi:hypothetical protein
LGLSLGLFFGLYLGLFADLSAIVAATSRPGSNISFGSFLLGPAVAKADDQSAALRPDSLSEAVGDPLGRIKNLEPKVDAQKELNRLLKLKPEKGPLDNVKNQTLNDAGYKVAHATGAKIRYEEILALIEAKSDELDEIFNFEPLLIKIGRLYLEPPVVTALTEKVALRDQAAGLERGLTYRLVRSGRLLGEIPSWRGYLIPPLYANFPDPDEIHESIRPTDSEEKKVWAAAVLKGWRAGRERADQAFATAIGALNRDYLGLIRFWELKAKGLVESPTIERAQTPYRASADEISWNETKLAIVKPGRFVEPTPSNRSQQAKKRLGRSAPQPPSHQSSPKETQ